MRTYLKALLLVGFGTLQMLEAAPTVSAADLTVKRVKRVAVHVIHHKRVIVRHRSLVVRDYDGTPIVVRRSPVVVRGYDGTLLVSARYDAYPVRRGQPTRYLNGEPVLPHVPRSWPLQLRTEL